MSTASRDRAGLVSALAGELRRLGDSDALFAQAAAERLGLNLTDFKCLRLLEREGAASAGRLGELTGLTSGAITGVIDRLEKSGFVVRRRDPGDRRLVILELASDRREDVDALLRPWVRSLHQLGAELSDAQLGSVVDFLAASATALQQEGARLRAAGAPERPDEIRIPLEGAQLGRLRFASTVARLQLRGEKALPDLFRARFEGRAPTVKSSDGTVTVQYARPSFLDWRRIGAEMVLTDAVPWQLELRGGASKLDADLREIQLQSLDLRGGVSDVTVLLPRPTGTCTIRLAGGASQVTLLRPKGTAARCEARGGVVGLTFDERHLGAIGGHMDLESPGYEGARDRYAVEIGGGAIHVTIGTQR